jgi:hypothetical protein
MVVSAGQQVIIMTGDNRLSIFDDFNSRQKNPLDRIQEVPLILNSDVAISLSSTFSPYLAGMDVAKGVSGLLSSITILRDFIGSGSFKQMGLQTWQSTEPIGLNLEVRLAMQTNAKREVYDPALLLMKLPLPTLAGSKTGGLIPPGPTIFSAIEETIANVTDGAVQRVGGDFFSRGQRYGLYIGHTIYLPSVVIKKVVPVFSSKTDENDYPIWCTLSMDIDSIYTATQEDIDNFNQGSKGKLV